MPSSESGMYVSTFVGLSQIPLLFSLHCGTSQCTLASFPGPREGGEKGLVSTFAQVYV